MAIGERMKTNNLIYLSIESVKHGGGNKFTVKAVNTANFFDKIPITTTSCLACHERSICITLAAL